MNEIRPPLIILDSRFLQELGITTVFVGTNVVWVRPESEDNRITEAALPALNITRHGVINSRRNRRMTRFIDKGLIPGQFRTI